MTGKEFEHLPADIIRKAVEGDEFSIDLVLQHYQGYIRTLGKRLASDGKICIDEDICQMLRNHLVMSLHKFKEVD